MDDVTRMNETLQIAALPSRYSLAIDSGNWDAMMALMADDMVFVAGDARFEGAVAVRDMTAAALDGLDHSQHYISNVVVDIDGETASVRSYLQAQHVKNGVDGGSTFLVGGVFRDRVAKVNAEWRFVERELSVLWTEGNPAVHP